MLRTLCIALLMLAVIRDGSAQEKWRVLDARNAAEMFDANVWSIKLSPNGMMLVGNNTEEICLLDLATNDETCLLLPDIGFFDLSYYGSPIWSPDSRYLTFASSNSGNDGGDVVILDTELETFTNVSNNRGEGSVQASDGFTWDQFPSYAPNGDLYFFRLKGSDPNYRLSIQRVPVGSDTIVSVMEFPQPVTRYAVMSLGAVSPDGTQFVFTLSRMDDTDLGGLWLADLTSGALRQLTTLEDAIAELPVWLDGIPPMSLFPVWTANGEGVVFLVMSLNAGAIDISFPVQNYLYVDIETGAITPIVNLRDFPPYREADEPDESGIIAYTRIPLDGVLSPDRSAFVYVPFTDGESNPIAILPLPPNGEEPIFTDEVGFQESFDAPNPLMSANYRALLGGWLYTFEPPE